MASANLSPFQSASIIADEDYDAVVVGGGLSGLVAAMSLLQADANLRVAVVESGSAFGGHLVTTTLGEVGAKWVAAYHDEIINLLNELGGIEIAAEHGGFQQQHRCKINGLNPLPRLELSRFIGEIDVVCADYGPNAKTRRWLDWTMESYIKDRLFFEENRQLVRFIVRAYSGVEPQHLYVDEFLALCYTCRNFSQLIDSLLGAPGCRRPRQTWLKVIEKIEAQLSDRNCSRLKKHRVIQITSFESRFLIVGTDKGKYLKTRIVIMAVPWQSLKGIQWTPPLWPVLTKRLKQHDSFSIHFTVLLRASVWHRAVACKLTSTCIDYDSRLLCFQCGPHTLSGSIYCNSVEEVPIDVKTFVLELLARLFSLDLLFPEHFQHIVLPQAVLINFPETESGHPIVWASTNSATKFRGFLNGAVQAGSRASIVALSLVRPSLVSFEQLCSLGLTLKCTPRCQTTVIQRFWASLNIASAVRAAKLMGLGMLVIYLYRKCSPALIKR